jgi:hypothetical protein
MFSAAIGHVRGRLNEHLTRANGSTEDAVVLSSVHQTDGSVAPEVENTLAMFVTNFQKDDLPLAPRHNGFATGRVAELRPPLHFNVYLMIAACHSGKRYVQGLEMLSFAVAFFQANPVFDQRNSPGLDRRIDRLVLDIENLDTQSISNLWGVFGGNYLPSVLYRLRIVTVDADALVAEVPTIRRPDAQVGG